MTVIKPINSTVNNIFFRDIRSIRTPIYGVATKLIIVIISIIMPNSLFPSGDATNSKGMASIVIPEPIEDKTFAATTA